MPLRSWKYPRVASLNGRRGEFFALTGNARTDVDFGRGRNCSAFGIRKCKKNRQPLQADGRSLLAGSAIRRKGRHLFLHLQDMPIHENHTDEETLGSIPMHQFYSVYYFMKSGALKLNGLHCDIFALVFHYWRQGRTLHATNGYLAEYLCCSREAVNRTIRDLIDMKLIRRASGQKTKRGAWPYTIDENTLCKKITGWSDIKSHICETLDHTIVCEKVTSSSDNSSHKKNSIKRKETKKEGKKNLRQSPLSLLPNSCGNDDECRRLWTIVLDLPSWKGRPQDALAESAKVLDGHPVSLCREMLRHTIEGAYPMIYPPTPEITAKAKSACDKKSHIQPPPQSKPDNEIFSKLRPYFPKELKDEIYTIREFNNNQNGGRGLKFNLESGKVSILCTPEVKKWLSSIQDILEPILAEWAGVGYTGYDYRLYRTTTPN